MALQTFDGLSSVLFPVHKKERTKDDRNGKRTFPVYWYSRSVFCGLRFDGPRNPCVADKKIDKVHYMTKRDDMQVRDHSIRATANEPSWRMPLKKRW